MKEAEKSLRLEIDDYYGLWFITRKLVIKGMREIIKQRQAHKFMN